ncbi:hypothetical protein DICVIV_04867 [Dictyocaulus viviparus]|uniref:Transthyretin-like family protein n=1 Tax=Dictyocaulus viviparus TaxID=29172 RepID=A0A0D8XZ36_DICVI|nr:hypothetical protein DICVIV_04867 [Dictyocaulus viviparus]
MRPVVTVLLTISTAFTCDLTAKLLSESNEPVWAQFLFHNGTESPVYEFKSKDSNHTVNIMGSPCNMKPTVLKSYKEKPGRDSKPLGESSAFIEGVGMLDYQIYANSPPRMGMRLGVSCGFGDCGARG